MRKLTVSLLKPLIPLLKKHNSPIEQYKNDKLNDVDWRVISTNISYDVILNGITYTISHGSDFFNISDKFRNRNLLHINLHGQIEILQKRETVIDIILKLTLYMNNNVSLIDFVLSTFVNLDHRTLQIKLVNLYKEELQKYYLNKMHILNKYYL